MNTQIRSLQKWQRYFSDDHNPALTHQFESIHGNDSELLAKQRASYAQMLHHFGRIYGDVESIVIARALGRVNLVGMQ
ncbi:hypothetical protein IH992_15195 [Candidatus Poribacteria bacterium]|nr:hypothetical protein [Candidatus Poribacteria bacterium]